MSVPVFRLGPLGRLVPLVSPDEGVSRSDEFVGAVHTSINASRTMDVRGYRRTWEFDQAYLEPDALSYLQSCFSGVVRSPLRLVDPINKNRLSKSTSAAAKLNGWSGAAGNWVPTTANSSTRTMFGDTPPVELTTERGSTVAYVPETYIRFETANDDGDTVYAEYDGHSPNLLSRAVPVFPGETLTVSGCLRTLDPDSQMVIGFDLYDAQAELIDYAMSDETSSSTWDRLSATYQDLPANAVAAMPYVMVSTAGAYDIAQLQLEEGPEATPWQLGNGCPEVLFTELQEESPVYPLVTASLRLEER